MSSTGPQDPRGPVGGSTSAGPSGAVMVGGRYQLGELLGRGGMAEVRKATDTRLGRVVAVKRLRTDLATDATFQARFRREAQSSASLNHPAIVAVYDTGEERTPDGVVQPYIVMEYVEGRTLRDVLREGRKILPERALEITSGVLSALDYSHRAGIIHRDIKPGNVMLTQSGDVKVMDFGIARALSDAASSVTQTAAVVGTAQYLSPEQARGETVDSRSDVYSAGCLMYELLTGRPPFVGDSPVAVAVQHVREPAVPPSHLDADLPSEVDAIAMKALTKQLGERYQSAAEMRGDIERYLAGRPVQAVLTPPPATTVAPAAAAAAAAAPGDEDDDDRRRRRLIWIALGAGLLVVILLLVWLWPRLFDTTPPDVRVPDVVSLTRDDAREAIGEEGLEVDHVEECVDSDRIQEGQVASQDPEGGEYIAPGSTVDLVVSTGACEFAMPPVVGQKRNPAINQLVEAGIPKRNISTTECSSDEPANTVVETTPTTGASISKDSSVELCLSDGPEQVPDVVGMQQGEAEQALRDAGFNPVLADEDDTRRPQGEVVRQSVPAGETRTENFDVTIYVSTYDPATESPTDGDTTTPTDPTSSPTDGGLGLPGGDNPGNGGGGD